MKKGLRFHSQQNKNHQHLFSIHNKNINSKKTQSYTFSLILCGKQFYQHVLQFDGVFGKVPDALRQFIGCHDVFVVQPTELRLVQLDFLDRLLGSCFFAQFFW